MLRKTGRVAALRCPVGPRLRTGLAAEALRNKIASIVRVEEPWQLTGELDRGFGGPHRCGQDHHHCQDRR